MLETKDLLGRDLTSTRWVQSPIYSWQNKERVFSVRHDYGDYVALFNENDGKMGNSKFMKEHFTISGLTEIQPLEPMRYLKKHKL